MSEHLPVSEEELALEPETGTGALRLDITRRVVAELRGRIRAVTGLGVAA